MNSTSHLFETASANQDLFIGLNQEDGETINGGVEEKFTIKNKTNFDITHLVDGVSWTLKPNESVDWTAWGGGILKFDTDGRNDYVNERSYDLENGKKYEFQKDLLAINLFEVA
ncbi:hypothetical protein FACHB389_35570 [Nostoc calcicola FACHB-389]|nr:hypothetical protein FACHB389_35570 [Nostoc calcicola FACHB-389]